MHYVACEDTAAFHVSLGMCVTDVTFPANPTMSLSPKERGRDTEAGERTGLLDPLICEYNSMKFKISLIYSASCLQEHTMSFHALLHAVTKNL